MKIITLLTSILMIFCFTACSPSDLQEELINDSVWEQADATELERLACSIKPDYSNNNLTPEIDCPIIGDEYQDGDAFNQHAYDMFLALVDYENALAALDGDDISLIDSTNILLLKSDVRMMKFDYLPLLPLETRSDLLAVVNQ